MKIKNKDIVNMAVWLLEDWTNPEDYFSTNMCVSFGRDYALFFKQYGKRYNEATVGSNKLASLALSLLEDLNVVEKRYYANKTSFLKQHEKNESYYEFKRILNKEFKNGEEIIAFRMKKNPLYELDEDEYEVEKVTKVKFYLKLMLHKQQKA